MKIAKLYRVEGRVQGVGFRWFVQRAASARKLSGYVKNLYDGAVEVYAIGPEDDLDEFRADLERGPVGAHVSRVDDSPAPLRPYKSFEIEF